MKILIISHEYPPVGGGGAGVCKSYARKLAASGHEVFVLTAGFEALSGGVRSEEGRLRIMRLKVKRRNRHHSTFSEMLDYLRKAVGYAEKLLKRERFDVCLTFFGLPGGPAAYKLHKKFGLPYCIRFGGGDIPGFQDRFTLLYKLATLPLKIIWKNAGALVANSEGLRKLALEFCDRYPITVIENGVDTHKFSPGQDSSGTDQKNQENKWHLLAVCRLIKRKGLQEVIIGLRGMEAETGCSIALIIVGDGPYREELEETAEYCGVRDQVRFEGYIDQSELPRYYQHADIFICPSEREGMPNTVLEAMASGLPIVMRESCQGSEELVKGNGVLTQDSFCAGIVRLIKCGKEKAWEMGNISRHRAAEEFSLDRAASRYEKLLKDLI